MSQARKFLENAENCIELADSAEDAPSRARYQRMAQAWFALAKEQEWLEGEIPPIALKDQNLEPATRGYSHGFGEEVEE
jgi:hypothetical protein